MALAIDITDGRGPISEARRELLVKKLGNVEYFPVHPAVKSFTSCTHYYDITNKTKRLSFKSGLAVWVIKLIKED